MKTLLDLGFTADERSLLLRGIHEGKYNLLLGAGASYGCVGGDGAELKDGATLSGQINDDFDLGLNPDEAKKLPLTYEEAIGAHKSTFRSWLRKRFTGCQPSWQSQIFQIHWERIWTFNIDDVLENAYDAGRDSNLVGEFLPFDWQDKVTPLESTPAAIQAIYLHGRASQLGNPSKHLIFSIPEYAAATRSFPGWHASFQTTYLEKPFIVCGASLVEEVDLAEAIRSKNQSSANGFPSILVSFSLDEGQKKRVRRYNLIPVVSPLNEFFTILTSEMVEYRKTADAVAARLKTGTYERFLAEFRRLEGVNTSSLVIKGTDFYGGDEPTWLDILNDRDVLFGSTGKAARMLDHSSARYAV
ncbi:SIR2 family protein, partial [Massilia cavernae]